MKDIIITIGRQTGSGGRAIGMKLSDKLGIPFYDRELLERAAKESGLAEEILQKHDEKSSRGFFSSLGLASSFGFINSAGGQDMPLDYRIFLAQFETIRKIADEGPCIIVGRCADYALEGYKDSLNVFICAPEEDRIIEMNNRYEDLDVAKAAAQIAHTDKTRASYYNYYTNKKWGAASGYDLCLNSSALGYDTCAEIIIKAARTKEDTIKK